jgi:hypothetical protein
VPKAGVLRLRGLSEREARRRAARSAGDWHLLLPNRIDGSAVVLTGWRRPLSSFAFREAVHAALGFGLGVYLSETEFEIWRHRDPGAT